MFEVKTHFNLSPAEYETLRSGHLERRRRQLLEDALVTGADRIRDVVEIGAGTGKVLADLAIRFTSVQFIGLDVDSRMVEYAQDRYRLPNVKYAVSNLLDDEPSNFCDLAFSIDVIHHVHEPLEFFQAVRRMLPPGGTWVAIEPNIFHPYILWHQERLRRAGYDEDHFRPWVMEPILRQAGFDVGSRHFRFLIPGWVKSVPRIVDPFERLIEGCPFLGGSVVYSLVAI